MAAAPNRPDRATVRRIIDEEALAHHVSADLIINGSTGDRASAARAAAIRKVMALTGCTGAGLAQVWGCSAETVYAVQRKPPPCPYDGQTRERFRWAHGEERAASIIAGNDPLSRADVTAWRSLGSGRP